MNHFTLSFIFSVVLLLGCKQEKEHATDIPFSIIELDDFTSMEEYTQIMSMLSRENNIDTTDARMIKLLSSNGFVAFEQSTDSIVNQEGKITFENLELCASCIYSEENWIVLVSEHKGFCHAFAYFPTQHQLFRYENTGILSILAVDSLVVDESIGNGLSLYATNQYLEPGDVIRYFYIDLANNTFAHTKNCTIVNGKKDCTEIKQFVY